MNAVLQMLDAYDGRSLVIAAINHEQLLDSAIWRRFEEVLFLKPPTPAQLLRLLTIKLRGVRYDLDISDLTHRDWFKDATHADVERIVRRAIKEMVMQGGKPILHIGHIGHIGHIEFAYRRERARTQRAPRR